MAGAPLHCIFADEPPAAPPEPATPAPEQPKTDTPQTREDFLRMLEARAKEMGAQTVPSAPAPAAAPLVAPPGVRPIEPVNANPDGPVHAHDPEVASDRFRFDFSEPTDVLLVVKEISDILGIQPIQTDGNLAGQKVYFGGPVTIERKDLFRFLVTILEQREYTITQDAAGIYWITPRNQIAPGFGGQLATTRVIRVPGLKPSALSQAITQISGKAGGAATAQPVYLDDLGVILVTDTPRNTQLIQDLVDRLVEERRDISWHTFELRNIAASSARERILELLGLSAGRGGGGGFPGAAPVPGQAPAVAGIPAMGAAGSLVNLSERLTTSSTRNALIFRGRSDETEYLSDLLALIDVPNNLEQKWYGVGVATAEAVAQAGKNEQLGEVSTFESALDQRSGGAGAANRIIGQAAGQQSVAGAFGGQQQSVLGSGFVIYPDAGGFIYRGTPEQHAHVTQLIAQLKDLSEKDRITLEFYKLKHGKAADVADVVQNLLTSSTPSANSGGGLLGRGLGGSGGSGGSNRRSGSVFDRSSRSSSSSGSSADGFVQGTSFGSSRNRNSNSAQTASISGGGGVSSAGGGGGASAIGDLEGEEVFVIADEPNNQVVVKAPARLQSQIRQLINNIDLRRPQVYIDAKIIAVVSGDDFRLAVEAQQIIGQFAINTNFGLGAIAGPSSGAGTAFGDLTQPKNVATNLPGLTAALIKSKDVPFIITALGRGTDSRIIASPQLLVDDNEEAEISSLDQQATTTVSQSSAAGSTVQGFGGYEDAGPKLYVRPQISEGGYMRLEYDVELSSFTGAATANAPPPRQKNNIKAGSVTVPSDSTIVVGGLTFDTTSKTVVKIPLLGDIPIFGNLFKDTSTTNRKTTLFVFITPKIMRDPSFADLRLITRAPLLETNLLEEIPPPEPERIDVLDTARAASRDRRDRALDTNRRRMSRDPERKPEDNRYD